MCRKQKEIIYLKLFCYFYFEMAILDTIEQKITVELIVITLFLDWNINSYIFFSQYLQHQHKLSGFCLVSLKSKILFKKKHPQQQPNKHVPSALSSFVDYYKILTQQYILTGVHVSQTIQRDAFTKRHDIWPWYARIATQPKYLTSGTLIAPIFVFLSFSMSG